MYSMSVNPASLLLMDFSSASAVAGDHTADANSLRGATLVEVLHVHVNSADVGINVGVRRKSYCCDRDLAFVTGKRNGNVVGGAEIAILSRESDRFHSG